MTRASSRRSFSPSPLPSLSSSSPSQKKPYTQAALDEPPILRRNKDKMFMTTVQIEDDDARIERELKARPCSQPPVNTPDECFPASGWPTGPNVPKDPYALSSSPSASSPALESPALESPVRDSPPPIPERSPLRPRWKHHFFVSHTLVPSVPSVYLFDSDVDSDLYSESEFEFEFEVPYTPETTGLVSSFSSSSSSEGGVSLSVDDSVAGHAGVPKFELIKYWDAVRMFEGGGEVGVEKRG